MPPMNDPGRELTAMVRESRKYKRWRERVEAQGNQILSLDVLSVVSRRPGTWYVAFIDCLLLTPEGNRITRCVTIRGESVVVVPLLRCVDDGQLYTVMVEQRCVCDGALHVGFPAGNSDDYTDERDLRNMASQELREETGLEISPGELVKLSDGITLNSSLSDDLIFFFGFRRDVSRSFLESLNDRSGGVHGDGEHIAVKAVPLSDCARMDTVSALIGLTLIEKAFGITIQNAFPGQGD